MNSSIHDEDFLNFALNFDIIFLSETWQKNENDFCLNGYESISLPRPESLKSKRGHGGICLFYKNSLKHGIIVQETDNAGFLWVKFCKTYFGFEEDLYVCFVYIPPSNSVYYLTHEIGYYEVLESKIRKYQKYGKVSVIGDTNARCGQRSDILQNPHDYNKYIMSLEQDDDASLYYDLPKRFSMDKTVNPSGNKLLDICLCTDLKIVNGRIGDDAGVGSFTFMSSNGNSLIDYVLMPYDFFQYITDFVVHDLYTCSNHVPIQVDIRVCKQAPEPQIDDKFTDKLFWNDERNNEYRTMIDLRVF